MDKDLESLTTRSAQQAKEIARLAANATILLTAVEQAMEDPDLGNVPFGLLTQAMAFVRQNNLAYQQGVGPIPNVLDNPLMRDRHPEDGGFWLVLAPDGSGIGVATRVPPPHGSLEGTILFSDPES